MGDSRDLSKALHYVNSRATQGLEMPPRTSASHLASNPGSSPSAAQSWPQLSMATRPGQRPLEAARANGTPVMMMIFERICSLQFAPNLTQRPKMRSENNFSCRNSYLTISMTAGTAILKFTFLATTQPFLRMQILFIML